MTAVRKLLIATCIGVGLSASMTAFAQQKIIVGFPAGGTSDLMTRWLADKLREATGHAWIAENRTGAGGRIAAEALKASAADGNTLLFSPIAAISIFPSTHKKLNYDPFIDFAPIALTGAFEMGLAVGPATPAKSTTELIDWLRANPAQANFGSPAAGSLPHFLGLLFAEQAGIKWQHINYRGAADAVKDLLGGQIPAMVTVVGDALPQVQAGKFRLLATSGAKRSPFAADVPTFAELGYKDLLTDGWYGLFARAGTSPETIERYNKIMQQALTGPEGQDRLRKFALLHVPTTPAEFGAIVRRDRDRWGRVVKASGFTADN